MKTITITIKGEKLNMAQIETALGLIGAEIVTEDKAEAKTEKKATKTTKKAKADDEFPRQQYVDLATEFGCIGKKGIVWKGCRPFIYAVIGWDAEKHTACKPTMTKAKAKKAVEDFAEENGWKLNNK